MDDVIIRKKTRSGDLNEPETDLNSFVIGEEYLEEESWQENYTSSSDYYLASEDLSTAETEFIFPEKDIPDFLPGDENALEQSFENIVSTSETTSAFDDDDDFALLTELEIAPEEATDSFDDQFDFYDFESEEDAAEDDHYYISHDGQ